MGCHPRFVLLLGATPWGPLAALPRALPSSVVAALVGGCVVAFGPPDLLTNNVRGFWWPAAGCRGYLKLGACHLYCRFPRTRRWVRATNTFGALAPGAGYRLLTDNTRGGTLACGPVGGVPAGSGRGRALRGTLCP